MTANGRCGICGQITGWYDSTKKEWYCMEHESHFDCGTGTPKPMPTGIDGQGITTRKERRAMERAKEKHVATLMRSGFSKWTDIQVIPISQSLDPQAQELVRIGLAKFSKPEIKGINGLDVAFPAGQVVTWIPRKARRHCYGLPLAYEPLPVEIVSGPRVTGDYRVRILAKHASRVLNRPTYDVDGRSLVIDESVSKQGG